MQEIKGGVTQALGFEAAGVAAEIKYPGKLDMALIYSSVPAIVAGAFTRNAVRAAPVTWDEKIVKGSGVARAVVVNAGIANACTGARGQADCEETARTTAALLGLKTGEVLVCSTGVIGVPLPMGRILAGVGTMAKEKAATPAAGADAARAIMTTDTRLKEAAVQIELGGQTVTIGGMAKGSGMIHPDMATMLAFVTTDACITKEMLTEAVNEVVADTYNMISVDGDTSTNDSVLVLANGRAANPAISARDEQYKLFKDALHYVNEQLAKMIAADGEGASTFIEVQVSGARSRTDARLLAKAVVSSNLVKAAVFGNDANCGRIMCALGYAGVDFEPAAVTLFLESEAACLKVFEEGVGLDYPEERASEILRAPAVTIRADMGQGAADATAWGCDLTYDYV